MNKSLTLLKKSLIIIILSFIVMQTAIAQIVITEIMYNPPESGSDSLEYIELYNNSNSDYDLNGASFANGVIFTFENYILEAGNYIAVAVDSGVMMRNFGVATFEWESGGLRNSGELIMLVDVNGKMLDSVNYGDVPPWPTDPDGGGASLELCNVNADNSNGSFWKASISSKGIKINNRDVFASPGAKNLVSCATRQIIVKNFEFDPAEITIKIGESIEWKNIDGTHNVNGSQATYPNNPDEFFSGTPKKAEWNFIQEFSIAGDYDYQCDQHINFGMAGIIHVVDDIVPELAITEIMYNSPDDVDSLEYLELKNQGPVPIELKDVSFSQGIEYTFEDITLDPGAYLVLASNASAFKSVYQQDALQWTNGSLGNRGELIEISSALGTVIDQVIYDNGGLWPVLADGEGRSLVLCDDNGVNDNAAQWGVSANKLDIITNGKELYGSPGETNNCDTIKVEIPPYTIEVVTTIDAEGVPDSIGVRCTLRGIVYGVDLQSNDNKQFTIIDETGGLGTFGGAAIGYTVVEGDEVEITGKIGQFSGLTQINIEALKLISQGNELKSPRLVTELDETTEGEFISMTNMQFVDPSKWQSNGRFFTVAITDGTNQFNMYIDDVVDLSRMTIPTMDNFNVIGIGGQFDRNSPFDEAYQINPRSSKDIIPLTATKEDKTDDVFTVVPNPFKDEISIISDLEVDALEVYSIQGELLLKDYSNTINLSNYSNGFYLLKVTFSNGLFANKRIVKIE